MRALILAGLMLVATPLSAHDDADWIRQRGFKNGAGELCCGERDCHVVPAGEVKTTAAGYAVRIPGYLTVHGVVVRAIEETVPYPEVLPSPDGQFWRCAWGGKRRCFFAPPMSH